MVARARVLYVSNTASALFVTQRLPLAKAVLAAGYEVAVAAPLAAPTSEILQAGLPVHPFEVTRGAGTPWSDFRTVQQLRRLYRRLRPDIVHHYSLKVIALGSIAARAAGVPVVVNAVTGLGHAFAAHGLRVSLSRWLVLQAVKNAARNPRQHMVFQNNNDRLELLQRQVVAERATSIFPGSGVDIERFRPRERSPGCLRVVLPCRMLWTKGVGEFVGAARALRGRGVDAVFALVGAPDPGNPASIPAAQLRSWAEEGAVEWWGFRDDMPAVLAQADVACLPSYGEGNPLALLEAAACGVPLIGTDVPGCREIVRPNLTGILVPPGNINALEVALLQLISDASLRQRLGARARAVAVAEFSLRRVVRLTLDLYELLLSRLRPGVRRAPYGRS